MNGSKPVVGRNAHASFEGTCGRVRFLFMKFHTELWAPSSVQAQSKHLRVYVKDRIIGTWKAANTEVIAYLRSGGNEIISFLYCGESSGTSDEASVMGVEQQVI